MIRGAQPPEHTTPVTNPSSQVDWSFLTTANESESSSFVMILLEANSFELVTEVERLRIFKSPS
jgi:hypothetical protein